MLNDVKLCGRLTADPELKTTPNGVSVTTFTLVVDRDYKSGEDKQADFINIVAWRNTAEFICKYWQKGKMMILSGSLQVRNYKAKDGTKRFITEVIANSVWFAGDKSENRYNVNIEGEEPPQSFSNNSTDFEDIDMLDADLPF